MCRVSKLLISWYVLNKCCAPIGTVVLVHIYQSYTSYLGSCLGAAAPAVQVLHNQILSWQMAFTQSCHVVIAILSHRPFFLAICLLNDSGRFSWAAT